MLTDFQVRNFFNQYASQMNNALFSDLADIGGMVQSFAEHFIGANPNGIQPGQNDDRFKKAISEGIAFYRKLGVRSMVILKQDVQILDELHALVKVHWNCVYECAPKAGEITFVNYYLVQSRTFDVLKIFSYVTGDEIKAFKEHGLL
jgi:hypothetical protein